MNQNETDKTTGIPEEELAMGLNTDENIAGSTGIDMENDGPREDPRDAEIADLKDKNLRLNADFDNFRRRNAKERIELIQTAGKDIIQSLLDVLDDTTRAEKVIESSNDVEAVKEGVRLVFSKLRNTLQQKGLAAMEAHGEDFNADLHEAITEVPAPSPEHEGKVLDVVQPGYYLNDKLIRHAKVVVGK